LGADVVNIGWAQCIKQKWCKLDEQKSLVRVADVPNDEVRQQLVAVAQGNPNVATVEALKKRRLALLIRARSYGVARGPKYAAERKKLATDLSLEMLRNGSWATEEWKEYNFNAKAPVPHSGALHPLMKVRHEFRTILMDMGFEEMPTNRFVESSFWNFDALFQPQQHPSRDAHDTFFLSDPATSHDFPADFLQRVKKVHEEGGYGSIGYRYKWAIEETQKNILRTHTTAISTRMLYLLAQQEKFEPKRYFSIDRVFRNETLDQTHLAEFHQVEGFIADYGLALGDLIGVIESFFKRIGISNVRFKPAYNPYTEPSMEIFGYSVQLGRWIEVGNSGIFRPEMLRPMGLPEGVNVIAWGLSLERPTMIKYGIDNIRDLFGPKVKLDIIAKNPIARYDI
jgi:phenylalanyl-tRNA synthetase alpha chain